MVVGFQVVVEWRRQFTAIGMVFATREEVELCIDKYRSTWSEPRDFHVGVTDKKPTYRWLAKYDRVGSIGGPHKKFGYQKNKKLKPKGDE